MKKIIGIVLIAGSLVACKGNKTNTASDTKVLSAADSVKMKEFEKWKEKEEAKKATTVVYRDRVVTNDNTAAAPAPVAKKKGWSKAAKGAVIGGVAGGVAGAVIAKNNRAAGAVVGTAVGAGVGYGVGRAKDKKDGRY
jgi:hypothetical protein